eukprot:5185726-Pleurochrysis_carterae.AAC.1
MASTSAQRRARVVATRPLAVQVPRSACSPSPRKQPDGLSRVSSMQSSRGGMTADMSRAAQSEQSAHSA